MNDNGYLQNILWIGMATALLVFGLATSVSFLDAEESAFPPASCLNPQPEISLSFAFCGGVQQDLAEIRGRPGGLYDPSPGNLYQDLIDRAGAADDIYLAAYLLALRASSVGSTADLDAVITDAAIADASRAIELLMAEKLKGAGLIRALGYAVLGDVALEGGDQDTASRHFQRAEQEYRDPKTGAALYAKAALMELRSNYDLQVGDFEAALGHADDAALAYLEFGLPNEASRMLYRLAEAAGDRDSEAALALIGASERYACEGENAVDTAYCQFARENAATFRENHPK